MTGRLRLVQCAAAALATLLLGACAGPALQPVERLDAVAGNQVILVGRIELVPPLHEHEQRFKALNAGSMKNRMYVLTDPKKRTLEQAPVLADYDGRIEATLGRTFFVAGEARPTFVRGGVVFLDDSNKAYFPGGLKISPRAGDKAIYVGTLEYRRDEFFNIQGVRVVDDFERANREFKEVFGARVVLRKALMTPP